MESVLIVDDDIGLCTMLRDYFELHQLKLAMCHDGRVGLQTAAEGAFDLVILDIMLPGIDGFEVLRRLRASSQVGILLLTARGEDDERIFGLENGADDYVPKPFNPRELLARMRAVLRRQSARRLDSQTPGTSAKLSRCGFSINRAARTAEYRSLSLALTSDEFLLLEALLDSAGTVLPREHLAERIFKRAYNPMDRGIDMLVSRLRRKLGILDNPGAAIKTIRSAGYVFAEPN